MKAIDLFSGCGGFSLGFIKANFLITKAVEFDPEIALTYKLNHANTELIINDIKNVDSHEYFKSGEADVIIGGPPCQGFSMAGARIRAGFIDDPRNYLFKHYFNIVKVVRPKLFIIENVKGLLTMEKGMIFNEILTLFSNEQNFNGEKYYLYYKVVDANDYGIPQKRERVIVIGVLNNQIDFDLYQKKTKLVIEKQFPSYFDNTTVFDAISNLRETTDDGLTDILEPETDYQGYLSSPNKRTSNHVATKHKLLSLNRMERIETDENFKVLCEKIKSVHSGSYGRMNMEKPSSTITTRFDTPSGGRFIHPIYNRTITPREAARIQSFPDDFVFRGSKSSICKQIGNAVPPKLSYFWAVFSKEVLNDVQKSSRLD